MVSKKTYAESLAEKYKGKEIEMYIGDDMGTLLYADHDISQKAVIRGVVKSGVGNFLTIEVTIKTAEKSYKIELDINSWCIKGVIAKQASGIGIMNVFGNQEIRRMKR